MQCYVCSSELSEIKVDPIDNKILPCPTCLDIVRETLGEFSRDEVLGGNRFVSDQKYVDARALEEASIDVGFGSWGIPGFMKN